MTYNAKESASKRLDEMNELAKSPLAILLPDGRVIKIRSWEPRIAVGECVSVRIDAIIEKACE
jgi:hypothetical protein